MRIAAAGFLLESASFLPGITGVDVFERAALRGARMIDGLRGTNTGAGGFIDACEAAGVELVGLVNSDAGAAGRTTPTGSWPAGHVRRGTGPGRDAGWRRTLPHETPAGARVRDGRAVTGPAMVERERGAGPLAGLPSRWHPAAVRTRRRRCRRRSGRGGFGGRGPATPGGARQARRRGLRRSP